MTTHDQPAFEISADVLLKAYACGVFPMAESADDARLYWIDPQLRGMLPLDAVRVPRRLARTIRRQPYEIAVDKDFHGVIDGCAASRPGRRSTWINERIRTLYGELFDRGFCHTVEARQNGALVGGLYGVALNGAFFGESMFSTATDASKIPLVYLCARLIAGGFKLLDTQFITDHLAQFGAIEIDRTTFHDRLAGAMQYQSDFGRLGNASPDEVLEIIRGAAPEFH